MKIALPFDTPFALASLIAGLCALALQLTDGADALPVLGQVPLLRVVLIAALTGWLALAALLRWQVLPPSPRPTVRASALIALLGGVLAVPPIAIDLVTRLPHDMNLPVPHALLFYPAITLVAEVVFHLLPLLVLVRFLPRISRVSHLMGVALIEPVFQMAAGGGLTVQGLLIFCNVSLISAAQIYLMQRRGFAACLGLRLSFYLAWHIVWGYLRLQLLW